jgi:CDP-diacylglycerol--glycerol-3-phosphate 3-phosphatidyltransferase
MSIPNLITCVRVFLIPVLVVVFYLPYDWHYMLASGIFIVASVSDWLDGYLARKWNQFTPFGAFFDPVADKLLVAIALVLLVEDFANIWLTIPAMVILAREIIISALREWMAEIGKRTSVAVSYIGKVKTALQMIAIIILLMDAPGSLASQVGLVMLYTAAILTLWSMMVYLKAAWGDLTDQI